MASTVDAKRVAEHFDSAAALENKLDTLAQYVRESRHTVFFTGAGVSTSAGIPDYRGPSGAWTERRIRQLQATASRSQAEAAELAKLLQERRQESEKAATKVPMTDAEPTYCHMAMAKMISAGQAGFVVTTNLDGIFRKAGLRGHKELCCLHGDVYVERCTGCGHDFERNYHVRDARIHVHDHAVGACTRCGSRTPTSYTGRPREGAPTGSDCEGGFAACGLVGTTDVNVGTKDTHINFGENLDDIDWKEADKHCRRADLCIVMGTSMSLRHITHFPFLAKKSVIVNLQATPDDARADLRVWAKCDEVMRGLLRRLRLEIDAVPAWVPADALPVSELRRRGVPDTYVAAAERLAARAKLLAAAAASTSPAPLQPTPQQPRAGAPRLTIGNTVKGAREQMVEWTAFVAGDVGDVAEVQFALHPTFTPSTVVVAQAPFAITRSGWGEFDIGVRVVLRGGATHSYKHHLCLSEARSATHTLAAHRGV